MTCIVILRVRVSSCMINMLIDDNKPTGELVPFCPTKKKEFLSVKRLGHVFVISRAMFSKKPFFDLSWGSSYKQRTKGAIKKLDLENMFCSCYHTFK